MSFEKGLSLEVLSGSRVQIGGAKVPVKICEGCEILPYLKANKTACYNFMGADWRHDIPGSKMDSWLLTAVTVARVSTFLFWFPRPQFPPEWHKGGPITTAQAMG